MLIWIIPRDDATGILDDEMKDGDPIQVKPDSFEPSIGSQEKKSYLVIKIPDPPNNSKTTEELVRPEYAPGPTPDANLIRRQRIFRCDWRTKFTDAEIALIENANAVLPDGTTAQGGTVTSGVVSGLFTIADFRRK